jgi:hypothetical protein
VLFYFKKLTPSLILIIALQAPCKRHRNGQLLKVASWRKWPGATQAVDGLLEVERGAASDRCNAPRVSGWRTAAMQLALQLRRGPTDVLRCCTPLHRVAWRCNLNCVPRCSYSQRLALFGSSTGGALQLSPAIAGARQPSARLKHQLVLQRRRRTLQRRATCRGTGPALLLLGTAMRCTTAS